MPPLPPSSLSPPPSTEVSIVYSPSHVNNFKGDHGFLSYNEHTDTKLIRKADSYSNFVEIDISAQSSSVEWTKLLAFFHPSSSDMNEENIASKWVYDDLINNIIAINTEDTSDKLSDDNISITIYGGKESA